MIASTVLCKIDGMEIRPYSGEPVSRYVIKGFERFLSLERQNAVMLLNGNPEVYGKVYIIEANIPQYYVFDFVIYKCDSYSTDGLWDENDYDIFEAVCQSKGWYYEISDDPDGAMIYVGDNEEVVDNILEQAFVADSNTPWRYKKERSDDVVQYRFFKSSYSSSRQHYISDSGCLCRHCGYMVPDKYFSYKKGLCIDCLRNMGYNYDARCSVCYRWYNREEDKQRRKNIVFPSEKEKELYEDICAECFNSSYETCPWCDAILYGGGKIRCWNCGGNNPDPSSKCSFCEQNIRVTRDFSTNVMGEKFSICRYCYNKVKRRFDPSFKDFYKHFYRD